MKNSSKVVLCCVLVAAIVIAGYVNFKLNNEGAFDQLSADLTAQGEMEEDVDGAQTQAVFFTQYRQEREDTREQEVAYLDTVINSGEADENIVAEAMNQKVAITQAMETELVLEGLIRGCGYSDAVVTCSGDMINVVVSSEALSDEQAVQILEVVRGETGKSAQNIKIIPQG